MTDTAPEDGAFLAELGRRVRLHRLYRGLTQQQLGAAAALSRNFVGLLESGRHGVDVRTLRRIALALDVPLPTLVAEPGDGSFPWAPGPRPPLDPSKCDTVGGR